MSLSRNFSFWVRFAPQLNIVRETYIKGTSAISSCAFNYGLRSKQQRKEDIIMFKYDFVTIFTKKGDLLPYLYGARAPMFDPTSERAREYYGKEREIELMLAGRWERTPNGRGTRLMCKISCPVNPLPVKGEFEVPSPNVIYNFLYSQGWHSKQVVSRRWLE